MRAYESGTREDFGKRAARTDAGIVSLRARAPHWVVTRCGHGQADHAEAMMVRTSSGEALPIFSLREEAESFLDSCAGGGWRLEEAGAGRLVSLLSGSRAKVGRVVLDPPEAADEAMLGLLSVGREIFLEALLGRGRAWFEDERVHDTRRGRRR